MKKKKKTKKSRTAALFSGNNRRFKPGESTGEARERGNRHVGQKSVLYVIPAEGQHEAAAFAQTVLGVTVENFPTRNTIIIIIIMNIAKPFPTSHRNRLMPARG